MTPEQLLGLSKPLCELSDAELERHLAPFFPHTRPRTTRNYLLEQGAQLQQTIASVSIGGGTTSTTATADDNSLAAKVARAMAAAGLDASGRPLVAPKKIGINLNKK